jgi:hypothetical protein
MSICDKCITYYEGCLRIFCIDRIKELLSFRKDRRDA